MKKYLIAAIVLGICGFIWSFGIEPNLLSVRRYKHGLNDFKGLKIVFASDWHIAPWENWRLKRIVKKINEQKPDIIILGGDYVKGHKNTSSMKMEKIAAGLSKLKAKYGVFAVLGNHDWYLNGNKMRQELEAAGITVLENENVYLDIDGKRLYLAGLADDLTRSPDFIRALNKTDMAKTLLITHSPDVFDLIPQEIPLTLAGHTHGGQVAIPFYGPVIVPSKFGRRFAGGEYIENGKRMIIGRGLGTSLLPVRFNCLPEILVLESAAND